MKLRALRALKREAKSAFIFVLERGAPLHRALAGPSNPAGSGRRQRVAPDLFAPADDPNDPPACPAWGEGRCARKRRICLRQQTTATRWRRPLPVGLLGPANARCNGASAAHADPPPMLDRPGGHLGSSAGANKSGCQIDIEDRARQNIRLSSDGANPLSKSQHCRADSDGCVEFAP